MAVVTRRYVYTGPDVDELALATDPGVIVPTLPYKPLVDITFDNAVADAAAVDAFMDLAGLVPDLDGTTAYDANPFFGLKAGGGAYWKPAPDATGLSIQEVVAGVFTTRLRFEGGQVMALAGSVAAPSWSFIADPDTGVYSQAANVLGFTANGAEIGRWSAAALQIASTQILMPIGAAGAPDYSCTGDPNTGVYLPGGDVIGFSANGASVGTWTAAALSVVSTQVLGGAGAVGTPTYSFTGDPNTGIYSVGADEMGAAAGGSKVGNWTTQGMGWFANASAATPGLYILGDVDTGLFAAAANTMGLTAGGVEMARWSDAGGVYARQQYSTPFALTYVSAGTTTVDATKSNVFTVTLTNTTTVLGNPTNLVAGMTLTFIVTQDGTGGRAMTFGTNYTFGTAGAPDLTTSGLGIVDIITAVAISSTKLACSTLRGF